MNQIIDYPIGNRVLKLNCSIQATLTVAEKYSSMEEALTKIDEMTNSGDERNSAKAAKIAADLLAIFAEQGHKYMSLIGEKSDKPYTADEIMILTPWEAEALRTHYAALSDAVTHGTKTTVEVEPPKNTEATPGDVND